MLVTGLPVSQFMNPELREALKKRLEGEHQITLKRSVTVKSVVVVPQPAGAYMDIVSSTKDEGLLEGPCCSNRGTICHLGDLIL